MKVVEHITGQVEVFAIIGNPISHSFSPILQNTVAMEFGKKVAYVPFVVEKGNVKEAINGAFKLGINGINVTVPHKKEVIECIVEIDELAQIIGAVNTLKRLEKGYKGYNTDILGLSKCFEAEKVSLEGKTVVILGAGGAANSGAVLAAKNNASKLYIVNRTKANAEILKEQILKYYCIDICVIGFEELMEIEKPEIVIQTN